MKTPAILDAAGNLCPFQGYTQIFYNPGYHYTCLPSWAREPNQTETFAIRMPDESVIVVMGDSNLKTWNDIVRVFGKENDEDRRFRIASSWKEDFLFWGCVILHRGNLLQVTRRHPDIYRTWKPKSSPGTAFIVRKNYVQWATADTMVKDYVVRKYYTATLYKDGRLVFESGAKSRFPVKAVRGVKTAFFFESHAIWLTSEGRVGCSGPRNVVPCRGLDAYSNVKDIICSSDVTRLILRNGNEVSISGETALPSKNSRNARNQRRSS